MDTKDKVYYIKCHDNITIQSFYLEDYKHNKEITFIDIEKSMML